MKIDTGLKAELVNLLCSAPCESEHEGQAGSCPDRRHGLCREVGRIHYCAVRNLADHLIANGVMMQKWISVAERLPDSDRTVLVADRVTGEVTTAYRNFCGSFVFSDGRGHGASHWMQLPDPPRKDTPGNGKASKTIGDKIRDMVASDEGIAEIMLKLDLSLLEDGREFTHLYCDGKNDCITEDDGIICTGEKRKLCIMRWLEQPAGSINSISMDDCDGGRLSFPCPSAMEEKTTPD